ncbi:unnamed protein product [Polarella glacialis]|uniref:Uncharacterized protein n=1 Tax=Polarella glacialis TaxID=89957 RepID=A0A813L6Y7_POLGL|nr:unnamed protein product [Polarella glacialis]CAE8722669.1 unnamed protein product [Polarella glacialis]
MGCTPSKTAAAAKVEEPSASILLQTTQGGAEVKPAALEAPAETTEPANAQAVKAEAVKAVEQELNELMELTITEVKPEDTPAQSCWMGCCASNLTEPTITEVKPEETPAESFL